MCRLAAWIGEPTPLEDLIIRPAHSLLEQSHDAALYAFRCASDAKCPTLYQRRASAGVTIASEPLDGESAGWAAVKPDHLLRISPEGTAMVPLKPGRVAA